MELRLEGTISDDGHLHVELPPDTPRGVVKVTIQSEERIDFEERNRKLFAWLDELDRDPTRPTRTREEVDAELQAERDSWN